MADRKLFEALYQSVARDLQKMKAELMKEVANTSAQVNSLCETVKTDKPEEEVTRELRYMQKQIQSLYEGVENVVDEKVSSKLEVLEEMKATLADLAELKYNYQQLQTAYEGLNSNADVHTDKVIAAVNEAKAEPIDYDRLAELVAAKVVVPVDYDRLAGLVAEKLAAKEQTYDVVVDDAGINAIADKVSAKLSCVEAPASVDYDRIAAILDEKLAVEAVEEETSYDLVLDEEGINAIAKGVAEELRNEFVCEVVEVPAEEPVDTSLFTPVEEASAEEPAPAPVEEVPVEAPVVEETPVEEPAPAPVEEVKTELAATEDPVILFDDFDENNLVDSEGYVIRLKKSFTAKLRQSEEDVKSYYSQIKNELTSYKKINSNVSWHADRFNFGRDTVAKMNICGKTLCLYLALDPNDPEFKSTVYHQKDVGNQKAYESTPFMVKVKSDAAAKKAVRLASALAEKLATDKEENFVDVNYVDEFAYETTKKLYEDGFIKATKEKKVDLNNF